MGSPRQKCRDTFGLFAGRISWLRQRGLFKTDQEKSQGPEIANPAPLERDAASHVVHDD